MHLSHDLTYGVIRRVFQTNGLLLAVEVEDRCASLRCGNTNSCMQPRHYLSRHILSDCEWLLSWGYQLSLLPFQATVTLWEPACDIFILRFRPKKQQFSVPLPTP